MIDAEDLRLVHVRVQQPVQLTRALEIGAERLLHDDTAPAVRRGRPRQSGRAQLLDDRGVDRRRDREVVQHAVRRAHVRQLGHHPLVEAGVVQFPLDVPHVARQRGRDFVGSGQAGELPETVVKLLAELVVGHRRPGDAEDGEARREALRPRQLVDGGQEFPSGQIAGRAEDHECGRLRRGFDA